MQGYICIFATYNIFSQRTDTDLFFTDFNEKRCNFRAFYHVFMHFFAFFILHLNFFPSPTPRPTTPTTKECCILYTPALITFSYLDINHIGIMLLLSRGFYWNLNINQITFLYIITEDFFSQNPD